MVDDTLFGFDEKAAARILGVTPRTLRSWRADAAISYHRLPGGRIRYTLDQLIEFQRACRVPSARCRTFPHSSAQG